MPLITFSQESDSSQKSKRIQLLVKVIFDGDTVFGFDQNWKYTTIRLAGIDAPETPKFGKDESGNRIQVTTGQQFAAESQKFLQDLLFEQNVTVEVIGEDTFKRFIGIIYLGDRCINLEMIKAGMAEAMVKDLLPDEKKEYISAQKEAKKQKLGIWSLGKAYQSPSDYRKELIEKSKTSKDENPEGRKYEE